MASDPPVIRGADPQATQKAFSEVHAVKGGESGAAEAQAIHDSKQGDKK